MSTAVLIRETIDHQLVAFHLASEIYALDIAAIHEIILMPEITHIPRTTQDIQGVINLRGKIVPILDLRTRLGLPEVAATRNTRIIVVEHNEVTVGMIVDDVVGVIKLSEANIDPPSQLIADLNSDFIQGVGRHEEQLIILLNLQSLLQEAERSK